jgi:hypothetical protein
MARSYSTLGDVIEQLKVNNSSTIDTAHAVDSLNNTLSKQFVKQARADLEASREKQTKSGLKNNTSPVSSPKASKSGGGFLSGLGNLKNLGFLGALGAIAGGITIGVIGILKALGPAGVGLGAFFIGLASAEAIIQKFASADAGEGIKKLLINLATGLEAFTTKGFIALGAVLAAGVLFPKSTVKGLAAVGIGLAAFLTALGASDALIGMMNGDGGVNLKNLMVNIAGGLEAFSTKGFAMLGTLMAGGALMALFPGGALATTVGLAAIGVGLGAFILALAGISKLGAVIGVDGSAFKVLITNIAGGLEELAKIPADGLLTKVTALAGIGPALISAVLGSAGAQGIEALINGAKKAMNFLFGTDFEDQDTARKSMVKNLVDALEPLNNIDMSLVGRLDSLSGALSKFVSNLNSLKSVSMKGFEKNVKDMMNGMALQIAVLDKMANGGKVGTGYFDGIPETDFGKGFLSPELKTDELVEQMKKVRSILGVPDVATPVLQTANPPAAAGGGGSIVASGNTTNNNVNNNVQSTAVIATSGPAIDVQDQLSRVGPNFMGM